MDIKALKALLAERGEPAYRLAQAKRAFFVELGNDWESVTTYSKPLREACQEAIPWNVLKEVKTIVSPKGDTVKTLFECADGQKIEAVLMRHEDGRNTVCASSQVGCAMACAFCATGTMGLKRNLSIPEIVEQVIYFSRWLKPKGEYVTNLVMMGMGEPFHNYDNVIAALKQLNDKDGLNLGARHMSISTCGIVPGILKLADEPLQVNLAISIHAGTDEVRDKFMPVNKAYPLAKLMDAVHVYMDHRLSHVNVIKYHPTEAFDPTDRENRIAFVDWLEERGISATHRVTFGEDIDAACGQLAVQEEDGQVKQGLEAVRIKRVRQNAK
jgi:23S rRNA (adenine2503-C2)-methyltransferase